MICYRDMTFCPFHEECKDGDICPRALTKKVQEDAQAWWGAGDGNAPICLYEDKPQCFRKG